MKKKARRLTLSRETLHRLDEVSLRMPQGQGFQDFQPDTQGSTCMSPWCGPTVVGCETQNA